jgi:hypothetical protein
VRLGDDARAAIESSNLRELSPDVVARLLDDASRVHAPGGSMIHHEGNRPDDEQVRPDDWYPATGDDEADAVMKELDSWDTLRQRRGLFLTLSEEG